jgi:RES domain-containing protein
VTSYRVVRRHYAGLTGEGARLYGGRFNPPGIPAVYTSQSIALAVLEILVRIDKSEVPSDYVVMAIRFSGLRVFDAQAQIWPGQISSTPPDFRLPSTARQCSAFPP